MRLRRATMEPGPAATSAQRPAPELLLPRSADPVPTRTRLRTRRVPVVVYVVALVLLPAFVVGGFVTAGWWATTGTTAAARSGDPEAADGAAGPADPADPADVKGSMTVEQVADAFPAVTAAQVLAEFGAPPDTPVSTQLKELVEAGGGTDIPGLRTWLEEQQRGSPADQP